MVHARFCAARSGDSRAYIEPSLYLGFLLTTVVLLHTDAALGTRPAFLGAYVVCPVPVLEGRESRCVEFCVFCVVSFLMRVFVAL